MDDQPARFVLEVLRPTPDGPHPIPIGQVDDRSADVFIDTFTAALSN